MIDVTDFKAGEDIARTASSTVPNPLNRVVDLSIEAFSLSQQVGDAMLTETLRASLLVAARLLAQKITDNLQNSEPARQ